MSRNGIARIAVLDSKTLERLGKALQNAWLSFRRTVQMEPFYLIVSTLGLAFGFLLGSLASASILFDIHASGIMGYSRFSGTTSTSGKLLGMFWIGFALQLAIPTLAGSLKSKRDVRLRWPIIGTASYITGYGLAFVGFFRYYHGAWSFWGF